MTEDRLIPIVLGSFVTGSQLHEVTADGKRAYLLSGPAGLMELRIDADFADMVTDSARLGLMASGDYE